MNLTFLCNLIIGGAAGFNIGRFAVLLVVHVFFNQQKH